MLNNHPWRVQDSFLELRSRWLTLIGEHLEDDQGNLLEYWRIEKADSVIVLPIQGDRIWLPPPSYRPGVGHMTLDFPGGRLLEGVLPQTAAIAILTRELGVEAASVTQLTPLSPIGWIVNSSFSNQKLYSFVAQLAPRPELQLAPGALAYSTTPTGIHQLLQELTCLQCRAVFLEWLINAKS